MNLSGAHPRRGRRRQRRRHHRRRGGCLHSDRTPTPLPSRKKRNKKKKKERQVRCLTNWLERFVSCRRLEPGTRESGTRCAYVAFRIGGPVLHPAFWTSLQRRSSPAGTAAVATYRVGLVWRAAGKHLLRTEGQFKQRTVARGLGSVRSIYRTPRQAVSVGGAVNEQEDGRWGNLTFLAADGQFNHTRSLRLAWQEHLSPFYLELV